MTSLLSIADRVVAQAKSGEGLEAYASRGSSTTIRAYEGEVESFTAASSAGIGIRVVVDGRVGFAHAGSLDDDVIAETLAEARDNVAFAEPDEWVALPEPDGGTPIEHDHWDEEVENMPTADKVQLALDLEAQTISIDPRVNSVRTAIYSDSTGEIALATSTGVRATDRGTGAHVSVSALASVGDETQIGGGFDVDFGPGSLDVSIAANDAVDRATRLLGAKAPKSQRLTLVLEPRIASSFLGILVGMLNGDRVIKGRTPFVDRRSDLVASPLLTITDDATDGRSYGASSVDGEGQTCRPNRLISDGVLQQFLHNDYSGRRSGDGTTANGVRGYRSSPAVGAHAVVVSPGEGDLADIISSVDNGLFVAGFAGLHSGVNAISGDFSVGVDGIAIRNGQLAEPVREATAASTLQKMLLDITHVGADIEWQPGGAGVPTIAISDVSLGGSDT